MARRLIERNVPFVEVSLGGWDTHDDNFARAVACAPSSTTPGRHSCRTFTSETGWTRRLSSGWENSDARRSSTRNKVAITIRKRGASCWAAAAFAAVTSWVAPVATG